MTREQYLQELRLRLSHRLPPDELERMMNYYTEYFDEAGPQGEQRVMEELGSPERLVRQIMGEQVVEDLDRPEPVSGKRRGGLGAVWTVILAICAAPVAIPLAIALVTVAFALVLAVLCVVFAVGVAGVLCVAFGVFSAVSGFGVILSHGLATTMYFVGGGMLVIGVGFLLIAGVAFLAGLCFKGIVRLLGRALHRGGARA